VPGGGLRAGQDRSHLANHSRSGGCVDAALATWRRFRPAVSW
jgi:hypothetical protein